MSQRFRLFPNSPTSHDLFDRDNIRHQWRMGGPVITSAIIMICVVMWAVEIITRFIAPNLLGTILGYGMFTSALAAQMPWTFITALFLHEPGIFHILFNMLTLWAIGPVLERMLGHWQFLGFYLLSGLGGDMALLLWARLLPGGTGWGMSTYGASGALFGLFAAIFVAYRRIGMDMTSMIVWLAINFIMPFIAPGIAWQAHVGGFVIGGLYAWLMVAGLPALRKTGLTARAWVYGIALFIVVAGVSVWCLLPTLG